MIKSHINIFIFFSLMLFCLSISAQSVGSYYNPKDDQYRLLGLKRAKELYESAKAEYDRQQEMMEKGLISQKEFETTKSAFTDAEVNYQQALLAVLFEQQYVSVIKAVKYQAANSQKRVRLTLANSATGTGEFQKLLNIDDELFRSLQPDVVNNVYVSLLNETNAIISQPYEAKINELRVGSPVTLDFGLLQDLDAVTVNIIYGSGTQRAPKIYLQKDASENKVIFQSEQFSQEVTLGESATFNFTLELFSTSNNTFKLEVLNLPKQINRYFVDPTTGARLSQFKFNETSQTRRAGLQVFLPDRPTGDVQMDQSISFFVAAIPYEKIDQIKLDREKPYTQEELEKLDIGMIKLELIPRGMGELLIKAPQLFYSVFADQAIEIPLDAVNEGTRRLNNVEFTVDVPLNWTKEIVPEVVESLSIREEKRVVIKLYPPKDASIGKYDIRVQATSLSNDQPIRAVDKAVTVEIKQEANVLGTLLIVVLILGLVAGIVIFGIKLSRK